MTVSLLAHGCALRGMKRTGRQRPGRDRRQADHVGKRSYQVRPVLESQTEADTSKKGHHKGSRQYLGQAPVSAFEPNASRRPRKANPISTPGQYGLTVRPARRVEEAGSPTLFVG